MHKQTFSLGFACALGACIGALSAQEIAVRFVYGSYLWAFGALFGGLVAYLVVDFREFCAGAAQAYRRTISWRPNRFYWKSFSVCCFGVMAPLVTAGIVLLCLILSSIPPDKSPEKLILVAKIMLVGSFLVGVIFAVGACETNSSWSSHEIKAKLLRSQKQAYWFLLRLNPFGALFFASC